MRRKNPPPPKKKRRVGVELQDLWWFYYLIREIKLVDFIVRLLCRQIFMTWLKVSATASFAKFRMSSVWENFENLKEKRSLKKGHWQVGKTLVYICHLKILNLKLDCYFSVKLQICTAFSRCWIWMGVGWAIFKNLNERSSVKDMSVPTWV